MPRYVDGYVLPIPKKNLATYKKLAKFGGKLWKKHGALAYMEAVGDDVTPKAMQGITFFPALVKAKKGETIVFAFVVYRSRAHRDQVNKKVMTDPAMAQMGHAMPFDMKRMTFGGFKAIVDA